MHLLAHLLFLDMLACALAHLAGVLDTYDIVIKVALARSISAVVSRHDWKRLMVVKADVVVLLLHLDAIWVVQERVWTHPVHIVVPEVVLAHLKVV